jgi:RNA polymerase sigma-70 factor (ECF subfamily)
VGSEAGSDATLVPREFAAWYDGCHDRVLAGVRVATGDAEHARDAVSEAFTRALERWDRVSVMERPEAWVYSVAVNWLRRRWRRAATERRLLEREATEDRPSSHALSSDLLSRLDLWAAVASLGPRQRQALALRYALGLTQQEVAREMGVNEGTAASTLSKARTALAQRLGAQEETPA